jgi:exopolyphosphatase/guanosine-5'-triphosphate,3'-diphosphate pyrophosphatase
MPHLAAIDVGSNTVRMLLAKKLDNELVDPMYLRQVTRLGGGYHPQTGLAPHSMDRTLQALEQFADLLSQRQIKQVKIVGTAALRRAVNSSDFIEQVLHKTGLDIVVISGKTEANFSCCGILSVLNPPPKRALLFDIGGGSTEIILFDCGKILLQLSLPLGVVRLIEDHPKHNLRHNVILHGLEPLSSNPIWQQWQQDSEPIELIGTAGTVTTLAALRLQLVVYNQLRVNNLVLERTWLQELTIKIEKMNLKQRLDLPGMEKGRADIILPGIQVVNALLDLADKDSLRVSDAGLLEGLLLG